MRHPAASPRRLAFAADPIPPGIGSPLRGLLVGTNACCHVASGKMPLLHGADPRITDAPADALVLCWTWPSCHAYSILRILGFAETSAFRLFDFMPMDLAWISLAALLVVIVVSCTTAVNPG